MRRQKCDPSSFHLARWSSVAGTETGARLLLKVCGVRMRDSRQMTMGERLEKPFHCECGQMLKQSPREVVRYTSVQIIQSSYEHSEVFLPEQLDLAMLRTGYGVRDV